MTLRDLQFRLRRLVVVVIGTGVVFALLLLMTGLAQQFMREPQTTVDGFGASRWIVRAGSTGAFTSAATIDESIAAELTGTPRADPVITARHSLILEGETVDIVVIGIVPGGLGEPRVRSGAKANGRGRVVADDSAGVAVGERIRIGPQEFTVSGLTTDESLFAGMPLIFMSLDDAQDLLYKGASNVTAVLTDRSPTSLPEGVAALTPAQIVEDARRPLENAISSIDLIRMLLWGVSALIIGGMVFLSAMERRRDFAVMKAAGASTRWLLGGVAIQGALIALASAVLAIGLQALLAPVFPMKVRITGATMVQLPVVAVIVALLAGGGGLRQVARIDPAAAFGGPGA
ncbi:MAG TPA: ABC transporter permease [Actinomycetota bacterium]|nr:ABC transporter permease [Actinomycetota bacterium]